MPHWLERQTARRSKLKRQTSDPEAFGFQAVDTVLAAWQHTTPLFFVIERSHFLGHPKPAMFLRLYFAFAIFLFELACPAGVDNPFSSDPGQILERTCFQTGQPWSEAGNLRSDVAIAYGIGADLPKRMETWREHGYRVHVMTGVSWGSYQDYLYGKFDGINHEDERSE